MLPIEEARLAYKNLLISYDVLFKEINHPSPSSDILTHEQLKIYIHALKIKCAHVKEQQNNNEYNLRRIESIVQESDFKLLQAKKMMEMFKKMN